MHDFRLTLSEAQRIDKLILELALYDVSGGLTIVDLAPDKIMELQKKALRLFNIFKKQIQYGEYTIEELEDDIVSRNAAISYPENKPLISEVDKFVDDLSKKEEENKNVRESSSDILYSNIIKSLFSGKNMRYPPTTGPERDEENPYNEDGDNEENNDNEGHKW